ncbi:MAG: DUF4209 domain-containing protein [Planctomycetota bacterium]
MLSAALADDKSSPEKAIAATITAWIQEEVFSAEHRNQAIADAIALDLSTRDSSQWEGCFFGPWASGTLENGDPFTIPPQSAITADFIQHCRLRAGQVDHPVAVARFLDLAWDLASLAGIDKDVEDARRATDSYIAQCEKSRSALLIDRALRRALDLASAIRDQVRASQVLQSLFTHAASPDVDRAFRLEQVAADLSLLRKNSPATDEQREQALAWMELRLDECAKHTNRFRAEEYWKRLKEHYRRTSDVEKLSDAARRYGSILEEFATKGNAMIAASCYQEAHTVYRGAGLTADARRIDGLLRGANERSKDEMSSFSESLQISGEEIERMVEDTAGRPWEDALQWIALSFWRRRADFEEQMRIMKVSAPIASGIRSTIVDEFGNQIFVPSVHEDPEPHIAYWGRKLLEIDDGFMGLVLDAVFTRHHAGPEKLAAHFRDTPLLQDDRAKLIDRALTAYFMRDHISFVHLALPVIEHAIRVLYEGVTKLSASNSRDSQGWQARPLGALLTDKSLSDRIGVDFTCYVHLVVSHPLGLNMRNLAMHGMVPQAWFSRRRSDRLMHVLLLLRTFRRQAVAQQPDDTAGK